MTDLKIPASKTSPEIIMTAEGNIKIRGRSIHENITEFYDQVGDWINEYIKSPAELTCLDINLEYFNSASSKILIQVCRQLSRVQLKHKKILINWYYEEGDDDILERGEYFSAIVGIRFNFIKLP